MARRSKYIPLDSPGLFDDIEQPTLNMPIHPDIAKYAEQMKKDAKKKTETELGPVKGVAVSGKLMFMSFGSGSSGNCAYLGDDNEGFLIDAGVEPGIVGDGLKRNGLSWEHVKAICITHDHSDHMRFAYSIVRHHRHIKIYSTPRALNGIMRRHSVSRRLKDYHINIYKEIPFTIGNFTITAFEVMHDGMDNSGYFIEHDSRTFVIATDLGCISERADYYMRKANFLMIESNYDADMLRNGAYPEYLKARIAHDNGHLDNKVTAAFLADIYNSGLSHVFLCHLSNDNNTPEKALQESRMSLEAQGLKVGSGQNTIYDRQCDLQLYALPRLECSPLFIFRNDGNQ